MKKILFIVTVLIYSSLNAKQECLNYGVVPYASAPDIEKSYQKWKRFIENKTKRCVKINIKSNYNDIIKMFKKDQLDFAFVGPFSYILTKKNVNVEPIVTGITSDGQATYRSLLTVSEQVASKLKIKDPLEGESGMILLKQKLQNYKQKWSIAFTDESSTSGYAVPSYYMKKVNLDPKEYFNKNAFVGTHDAALQVVAHNIIPMAFSAQMLYEQMLQSNKISNKTNKVIWRSDQIPKSPIIVKSSMELETKKKLQEVLISLPKEFFPKLGKTIGYIKTDESNYKIIENIHKYLKN